MIRNAPKPTTASSALLAMAYVVLATFVGGALYFGKEILVPIALAALLTFLLTPLVTAIERFVGRVIVVLLLASASIACGWLLSEQVIELATKLPDYQENIHKKLQSIRMPSNGKFNRVSQTLEALEKEVTGATPPPAPELPSGKPSAEPTKEAPPSGKPVEVQIVRRSDGNPVGLMGGMASHLLGPLGTAFLVLLLVIFMLLKREDVRGRLIRLIGQSNISATTRAMDDAGTRVSRYLLMQLLVNAGFGVCISIGLSLIGVPNAILWGILAAVLRFVPYVGTWVAAALPVMLSLAVSRGWTMPILALALFVVLDLAISNAIEPLLYGSSTGVSSIALILAAVFWTWLWGTIGLVMATPLTVCLVVIGRHVPKLQFFSVLLSDEEALSPSEECYHRLLAGDLNGASRLAEQHLESESLASLCDTILLPVLAAAERDFAANQLENEQRLAVQQAIRDILGDVEAKPVTQEPDAKAAESDAPPVANLPVTLSVVCVPARTERDEIAGAMLSQLLRQSGFTVENFSAQMTNGEVVEALDKDYPDAVVISVIPPSTVIHARFLCARMRSRFPKLKIIVCSLDPADGAVERLRAAGADDVTVLLSETAGLLVKYANLLAQESFVPSASNDASLPGGSERAPLTDSPPDREIDKMTSRLARTFGVPIVEMSSIYNEQRAFQSRFGAPSDAEKPRDPSRSARTCCTSPASSSSKTWRATAGSLKAPW